MLQCPNPRFCWVKGTNPKTGKSIISFDRLDYEQRIAAGLRVPSFQVPCGVCSVCKRKRREDMTLRILKETDCYQGNVSFLTLTYNEFYMPRTDGESVSSFADFSNPDFVPTLYKRDIQLFLKRLRITLKRDFGISNVRFCCAGEYGKKHIRPHWHMLIFGFVPPDLTVWENMGKYFVYRSKLIESLWPFGFSSVGFGNGAVGRYVAKYLLKDGVSVDPRQVKECFWASNRSGGLGKPWWNIYDKESCARGVILSLDRKTCKAYYYSIPPYFKKLFKRKAPFCYQALIRWQASLISTSPSDHEKAMENQRNSMALWYSRIRSEVRRYEDDK